MNVSIEDIREKMRAYLAGEISRGDFNYWIDDESLDLPAMGAQNPAEELLASLALMACEMVCSGKYRTEAMFRQDLESILRGELPGAFWDASKMSRPSYL